MAIGAVNGKARSQPPLQPHPTRLAAQQRSSTRCVCFEGLGMGWIHLHPNYASILQLVDQTDLHLDRYPAFLPGRRLVGQRDNSVIARVDQALGRTDQSSNSSVQVRTKSTYSSRPRQTDLRRAARCDPLGLGSDGPRVEGRAGIASLQPRLEFHEDHTHDLDVLLRHRRSSISREWLLSMQSRTAAFRPKRLSAATSPSDSAAAFTRMRA